MTFLKRLRVLPAVLGVAAALAAVGTTLFGDCPPRRQTRRSRRRRTRPDGARSSRNSRSPSSASSPRSPTSCTSGDMLFAWQVKPTVEAAPARPRDVLVMVDTSASQAGQAAPAGPADHLGLADGD